MNNNYKNYFLLGEQYYESARLLLDSVINNDNCSIGIGDTAEEAERNLINNIVKSDVYLFIPALFISIQCVELYIKGILLINSITMKNSHETSDMISSIKGKYGSKSSLYLCFNDFYNNCIKELKNYKKTNNITTTKELYDSLRYPEGKGKVYDYFDIRYNGQKAIEHYKKMVKMLEKIHEEVLIEFRKK